MDEVTQKLPVSKDKPRLTAKDVVTRLLLFRIGPPPRPVADDTDKIPVSKDKPKPTGRQAVMRLILGGLVFWVGSRYVEVQAKKEEKAIQQQVYKDMVAQYEMARAVHNRMDMCVHAGLVMEAALQMQDKRAYFVWTAHRNTDCDAVGVPTE